MNRSSFISLNELVINIVSVLSKIDYNDINAWDEHIDEILKIIVKRSLRWPKASYLERFGTVHTLNHPQEMLELTESSDDFIRWQKRLDTVLGLAD